MNINTISPVSIKASQNKKLIPVKDYKGPKLKLTPTEAKQVQILSDELNRLELESYDVIRTMSVYSHLNGYQKQMCRYRLSSIGESIDVIKNKIFDIKKNRFAIQTEKFMQRVK